MYSESFLTMSPQQLHFASRQWKNSRDGGAFRLASHKRFYHLAVKKTLHTREIKRQNTSWVPKQYPVCKVNLFPGPEDCLENPMTWNLFWHRRRLCQTGFTWNRSGGTISRHHLFDLNCFKKEPFPTPKTAKMAKEITIPVSIVERPPRQACRF